LLGRTQIAADGERELVAAHPVVASEREHQPTRDDKQRRGERDRRGNEASQEQVGAVAADAAARE
jgi:hypothetical protein